MTHFRVVSNFNVRLKDRWLTGSPRATFLITSAIPSTSRGEIDAVEGIALAIRRVGRRGGEGRQGPTGHQLASSDLKHINITLNSCTLRGADIENFVHVATKVFFHLKKK